MMENTIPGKNSDMREKLGICQWFQFQDTQEVFDTINCIQDLSLKHLRTGISWADYLREGGKEWYDWLIPELSGTGVEILVSVWHIPPSLSENGRCNGPPKDLKSYADFLHLLMERYGSSISAVELFNEPNNWLKWDFIRCDRGWRKYAQMLGMATYWLKYRWEKTTVLGGLMPVDHGILTLLKDEGVYEYLDIVGIHGFFGMPWNRFNIWGRNWCELVDYITDYTEGRPVWVTEAGFSTFDATAGASAARRKEQVIRLEDASAAPVSRLYWYSMLDLDPKYPAIEESLGVEHDPLEYHMGLVTCTGAKKPAYQKMKELMHG